MRTLHIDIETYSPEPIADAGLYRYSESPDFEILLVAYARDDEPVGVFDLASGDVPPEWFIGALTDPSVLKAAHNAAFERVCLTRYLRRLGRLGPEQWLDPGQWHCTMVQCSRCGLPLSLAQAGAALGLPEQKMTEGKALIRLFCTPHETKTTGGLFGGKATARVSPEAYPDKWETFKAYCLRDVEVEREIDKATQWYTVTPFERALYAIDQHINDRGVLVDLHLARNAVRLDAVHVARLTEEAMKLTGLPNPNSVAQLCGWLSERLGYAVESLPKTDLPSLMASTDDPAVKRVLAIRQETGKTSNKKWQTMLDVACSDGRARGLTQFYGSRTGRWAGRLIQMQNLPQTHLSDLALAREDLAEGDADTLELCWGSLSDTLSQLIRTAFIAPEGKTLAVCDFSAIEARVLAWVAGEDWVLDVFRSGGDIYCATASQMFHVPVEKHGRNAELRQKGKIAVLALGYGGGVGALDAMGGQRLGMTSEEERETVTRWRKANPNIVSLWDEVESAATACATTGESRKVACLSFAMQGKTLTITLPSGRVLCYPDMGATVNRFGSRGLKYHGLAQATNRWGWIETFGGKLVENIIQAIARDCLAVAMTRTEQAGIPVVFHVHDELICETTEDRLADLEAIFATPVDWADGLPLKGAGFTSPFYMKD